MESVKGCLDGPNAFKKTTSVQGNAEMLPRPCSMPNFDRKVDDGVKRGIQTLPLKRSAKRGLDLYKPWKSMSSSQGLFGNASPTFGTPSYPTHLDMIRGSEAGLSTSDVSSYSAQETNNNVLDSLFKEAKSGLYITSQKDGELSTYTKNLGESLHSFSFAPGFSRGTFASSPVPGQNSLNASWQFYNFIGGAETSTVLPTTTRSPNKAILTIDGRTSKILVANEIAGKLFGYLNGELAGMKISELFTMKDGFKQNALLEQHIDTEGNIVMISGKVVEAVDRNEVVFPVSIWMKRIHSDGDPRCVAVIEPVQRAVGSFLFNAEGTIIDCDSQFALVHGYSSPEEIIGTSILHLIPAFMLPIPGHDIGRTVKKQTATGKTRDNVRFPISIQISEYDKEFHELYLRRGHPDELQFCKFMYMGKIWVFSNISGLISVFPNGSIHSCNDNFSRMFFGYSDSELLGKDLTDLIPLFYDYVELAEDRSLKLPSISDDGEVQLDPKRFTAMSSFAISSQADSCSDVESLGDSCAYLRDSKEETEAVHSSQTTASSLTILSDGSNRTSGAKSMSDSSTSSNPYLTPRGNEEYQEFPQHSDRNMGEKAEEKGDCFGGGNMNDEVPEMKIHAQEVVGPTTEDGAVVNSKESPTTSTGSCDKSCCLSEKMLVDKTGKEVPCDEERQSKEDKKGNSTAAEESKQSADENSLDDGSDEHTPVMIQNLNYSLISNVINNTGDSAESYTQVNADEILPSKQPYAGEEIKHDLDSSGLAVISMCKSEAITNGSSFDILTEDGHSNRGTEYVDEDGSVVVDDSIGREKCTRKNADSEGGAGKAEKPWQSDQFTSTPKTDRSESLCKKIYEGNYCGQAKHKDGSLLPIVFQIKKITLDRGQDIFCIWVSRDIEEQGEKSWLASQALLNGSLNSTLNASHGYLSDVMKNAAELSRSLTEENLKGRYDEKYLTLKSIGKGAFGFVKLAQRRSDNQEVVVKFIQKSKIVPSSWIEDENLGMVPLEVFYLAKIDHPNVVKMCDVFENDDFFQLVMEKHGDGIDLFEFIDRQPALDEPLCAYMFKQVVSAVSYLHSQNILHRDVKDENIIVDRKFTLKLIDFGSAVLMEEGKLFSTFCGTVEYCSPEVLLGNRYRGPELEVWSMGITLYTLVFGENPFFDVEETIKAELRPPFRISAELMFLICWMLHPEPRLRATVNDVTNCKWLNQYVDVDAYDYDSIFAENREEYYDRSEDGTTPSSIDYEENYGAQYDEEDCDEQEYIAENERLEEEYIRYFRRQCSLPDYYDDREHGASF